MNKKFCFDATKEVLLDKIQVIEYALNESNTHNATILEFDFTSVASQISFRHIFASEEYQATNPNSFNYSD